jgi:hypothetical protein
MTRGQAVSQRDRDDTGQADLPSADGRAPCVTAAASVGQVEAPGLPADEGRTHPTDETFFQKSNRAYLKHISASSPFNGAR